LAGLRKRLTQAAKGNPLFVEESVRALADSKALTGKPGTYHLWGEVKGIEVPATVPAIIASRIDRLSAATKGLLQSAAAIGYEFPFAVLRNELATGERFRRAEACLHDPLAELHRKRLAAAQALLQNPEALLPE
jgi:hypothetical protein